MKACLNNGKLVWFDPSLKKRMNYSVRIPEKYHHSLQNIFEYYLKETSSNLLTELIGWTWLKN